MREPMTLLQKEDKRKITLSIIEDFILSSKTRLLKLGHFSEGPRKITSLGV